MAEPGFTDWLHGFVLPLCAGGDVRVSRALGEPDLAALLVERPDAHTELRIAEARHQVTAELLLSAPIPELDDEALKLAVAVQNLLFLSHPAAHGTMVRKRRLEALSAWSAELVQRLEPAEDARTLVARHSMLHHLFDLGRDDVRVSFWAGKREFRGAEPPARLLKWSTVRRVREERWRVSFLTEAVTDPLERPIVLALLSASPLTDLWEPLRLDPALEWKRLARLLGEPAIARAAADRYLSIGFAQLGGPLTASLLELYNQKNAVEEARRVTRFVCHLHLLRLLQPGGRDFVPELQALCAGQPQVKDFFGLFAAAQRVGLGRPDDVASDERLTRRIDAYAAACTTVCGVARVVELEGVMSRGVQQLLLSASPG